MIRDGRERGGGGGERAREREREREEGGRERAKLQDIMHVL